MFSAPAMSEETLKSIQEMNGIFPSHRVSPYIKILPDGHCAYLLPLMYTTALCLGATETTAYRFRFCFPNIEDAIRAFNEVQCVDWIPPYGWCAARPEGRLMQEKHLIQCVHTEKADTRIALGCRHFMNIAAATQSTAYCKEAFMSYVQAQEIAFPEKSKAPYLFACFEHDKYKYTLMLKSDDVEERIIKEGRPVTLYEPTLYRLWHMGSVGFKGVADFFNQLPETFDEAVFLAAISNGRRLDQ